MEQNISPSYLLVEAKELASSLRNVSVVELATSVSVISNLDAS